MMKLLFHAAEAKVYHTKEGILKDRIEKSYRHPALDRKIRINRTKKEARLLTKAKVAGISVPGILQQAETILILEEIKGKKLAHTIDKASNKQALIKQLGTIIAQLHNNHLIHGDLTTSNVLCTKLSKLTLIDFGLGFESQKPEDKATDLHVLKEALEAKHYKHAKTLWTTFLTSYKATILDKRVLERLTAVEKRGRYKQQF